LTENSFIGGFPIDRDPPPQINDTDLIYFDLALSVESGSCRKNPCVGGFPIDRDPPPQINSPTTKQAFSKPFWHSFNPLRAIKKAQILAYFRIRNRIPNRIPILFYVEKGISL